MPLLYSRSEGFRLRSIFWNAFKEHTIYSLIPCSLMVNVVVLEAVARGCQQSWASTGSFSGISWISSVVGALLITCNLNMINHDY